MVVVLLVLFLWFCGGRARVAKALDGLPQRQRQAEVQGTFIKPIESHEELTSARSNPVPHVLHFHGHGGGGTDTGRMASIFHEDHASLGVKGREFR